MRYFNTSGPNNPKKHYTLLRPKLIEQGLELVSNERYFTIWAPRQTGKSTYFLLLKDKLVELGYKVCWINTEFFSDEPEKIFLDYLVSEINLQWKTNFTAKTIAELFINIRKKAEDKCVLIIDEVEGINQQYFGKFLHAIRAIYHNREQHCLKSVILVGVANITGIVQDNASPFNIADNLDIPYFTKEEVWELYSQHEQETGQKFTAEVKDKIYEITAGQPGLVNGFGWKLVNDYPDKNPITLKEYFAVEDWYLNEALDKNIANILNKAKQYRAFIERLLFKEEEIPFNIDRPAINFLYVNGLIRRGKEGKVEFWVPLYKKRVYQAFYPYTNGERDILFRQLIFDKFIDEQGNILIDRLIKDYKSYVRRRGFRSFLERDDRGRLKGIKESALIYSFETYISAVIEELGGKIYREADTGLGKTDMIINLKGKEIAIEVKIYSRPSLFHRGKQQLAYYCKSLGIKEGIYLVFTSTNYESAKKIKDSIEEIEGVKIHTYIVWYDEKKDF